MLSWGYKIVLLEREKIFSAKGKYTMSEFVILLIIIGVWFLLQVYILPKLGISTWVRDSCQVTRNKEGADSLKLKEKND